MFLNPLYKGFSQQHHLPSLVPAASKFLKNTLGFSVKEPNLTDEYAQLIIGMHPNSTGHKTLDGWIRSKLSLADGHASIEELNKALNPYPLVRNIGRNNTLLLLSAGHQLSMKLANHATGDTKQKIDKAVAMFEKALRTLDKNYSTKELTLLNTAKFNAHEVSVPFLDYLKKGANLALMSKVGLTLGAIAGLGALYYLYQTYGYGSTIQPIDQPQQPNQQQPSNQPLLNQQQPIQQQHSTTTSSELPVSTFSDTSHVTIKGTTTTTVNPEITTASLNTPQSFHHDQPIYVNSSGKTPLQPSQKIDATNNQNLQGAVEQGWFPSDLNGWIPAAWSSSTGQEEANTSTTTKDMANKSIADGAAPKLSTALIQQVQQIAFTSFNACVPTLKNLSDAFNGVFTGGVTDNNLSSKVISHVTQESGPVISNQQLQQSVFDSLTPYVPYAALSLLAIGGGALLWSTFKQPKTKTPEHIPPTALNDESSSNSNVSNPVETIEKNKQGYNENSQTNVVNLNPPIVSTDNSNNSNSFVPTHSEPSNSSLNVNNNSSVSSQNEEHDSSSKLDVIQPNNMTKTKSIEDDNGWIEKKHKKKPKKGTNNNLEISNNDQSKKTNNNNNQGHKVSKKPSVKSLTQPLHTVAPQRPVEDKNESIVSTKTIDSSKNDNFWQKRKLISMPSTPSPSLFAQDDFPVVGEKKKRDKNLLNNTSNPTSTSSTSTTSSNINLSPQSKYGTPQNIITPIQGVPSDNLELCKNKFTNVLKDLKIDQSQITDSSQPTSQMQQQVQKSVEVSSQLLNQLQLSIKESQSIEKLKAPQKSSKTNTYFDNTPPSDKITKPKELSEKSISDKEKFEAWRSDLLTDFSGLSKRVTALVHQTKEEIEQPVILDLNVKDTPYILHTVNSVHPLQFDQSNQLPPTPLRSNAKPTLLLNHSSTSNDLVPDGFSSTTKHAQNSPLILKSSNHDSISLPPPELSNQPPMSTKSQQSSRNMSQIDSKSEEVQSTGVKNIATQSLFSITWSKLKDLKMFNQNGYTNTLKSEQSSEDKENANNINATRTDRNNDFFSSLSADLKPMILSSQMTTPTKFHEAEELSTIRKNRQKLLLGNLVTTKESPV